MSVFAQSRRERHPEDKAPTIYMPTTVIAHGTTVGNLYLQLLFNLLSLTSRTQRLASNLSSDPPPSRPSHSPHRAPCPSDRSTICDRRQTRARHPCDERSA